MIKKAIFGGTFDPIHLGHMYIAYEALHTLNLDKIIFVPSGNPPHKSNKKITNANIRYDMVLRAIKGEKKFEASDYEIKKSGFSYTYETINFFNSVEKDTDLYFISGLDCLMEIDTWKNTQSILSNCKFVVFNRPGYSINDVLKCKKFIENKYHHNITFLNIPFSNISSTVIRNMIRNNMDVSNLLPRDVYNYIKTNNLYLGG